MSGRSVIARIIFVAASFLTILQPVHAYNCRTVVAAINRAHPDAAPDEVIFRRSIVSTVDASLRALKTGDLKPLNLLLDRLNEPSNHLEWVEHLELPWEEIISILRHAKHQGIMGLVNQVPRMIMLAKIRNILLDRANKDAIEAEGNWIKWARNHRAIKGHDDLSHEAMMAASAQAALNSIYVQYFNSPQRLTDRIIEIEKTITSIPIGEIYIQFETLRRLQPDQKIPQEYAEIYKDVQEAVRSFPIYLDKLQKIEDQTIETGMFPKDLEQSLDKIAATVSRMKNNLTSQLIDPADLHWKLQVTKDEMNETSALIVGEFVDEAEQCIRSNDTKRLAEILGMQLFSVELALTEDGQTFFSIAKTEETKKLLEQYRTTNR